jgi:hypothetical protein
MLGDSEVIQLGIVRISTGKFIGTNPEPLLPDCAIQAESPSVYASVISGQFYSGRWMRRSRLWKRGSERSGSNRGSIFK